MAGDESGLSEAAKVAGGAYQLRDRFAAAAITGMLADPDGCSSPTIGARIAYEWADALMAARLKRDGTA
jgi:hypothetical protein